MANTNEEKSWRAKYRPYIGAAVLAVVLTMFVAPEVLETNIMEPAIGKGEVIIYMKEKYSENRGKPEPGQVVVLSKGATEQLATKEKNQGEDNLVARVIGLPGDQVEIRQGAVYCNGNPVSWSENRGSAVPDINIKVKEGNVVVLGDKGQIGQPRPDSLPIEVDMKEIRGKAKFVIWPISKIRSIE